jgi:transposase
MRYSIDGLASLVKYQFKLDLFSSSLFVFCNRQKNKIKILYWHPTGFTLWYKRLERGRYRWPDNPNEVIAVSDRQLSWLLDGLTLEQPKAHKEVTARVMF